MKVAVLDVNGVEKNKIDLNDSVFNIKPNMFVIYEAIKNELANKRQGTSSTKTKSEVRGSGAKPHRQKGTGRARVGTKRNPVWIGGGVAFGPKPRDFSYKLPKKIKRLAYRSVFSLKNRNDGLKIVENFAVEGGKTKILISKLNNVFDNKKSVLVVGDSESDLLVKRAARNISWLKCLSYKRLNVHSLFYSDNIVISEDVAKELNAFYENNKAKEEKVVTNED